MTLIVFAALSLLTASGVLTQTEPPISRNPCLRVVCKNGGRCISPLDFPICQCTSGYGGARCENKVPVKDGTCPPPPNTEELNCRRGCDNDESCPGTQKCCNTNCERQCTNISPPHPAPPLTCATVLCASGSVCREVVECLTCPIKVTCVPQSDLTEADGTCRRNGYSQAILLEQQSSTTTSYSQLLCRDPSSTSTRMCPSGSVCVAAGRDRGVCCRGKINPIDP